MEYEMEAETVLFDPSTNPSLERRVRRPLREVRPHDRRQPQKAELIPEEDQAA
ncbi:MAG TPA: hypothetical protein VI168_04105 [Croceibacterium sp.]